MRSLHTEALRVGQNAPAEHRVFRDMAEARQWLGLEPEAGSG